MTGMAADNRRSYTDRVAGRHPGLCFWSSQNVVQSMMKGETGMVISREKKPFEKEETPWRKNTISQYHTQGDNKETSHTVFFHNLTERTGKKERNFKNSYPEQPSNKRIGRTRTGEPPLITPYKHRETTRDFQSKQRSRRVGALTTAALVSLTNIIAVGLCSTSQIRGEDAPPVRISGADVSLDGGGEAVRREAIATGWQRMNARSFDREEILAQKGKWAP
ncbi:hypothetical protein DEO72_LG6g66 [Vigna unguiculata]|nr:hypothetical protein DEO72_LG6g66 [Vigna unguiculata]